MVRSRFALCLLLACATAPDKLEPQNPGDRCIDVCPDGLICTGTTYQKSPRRSTPGRCELRPGRCAADTDCTRSQRCVRTSNQLGLCAEAPQL
jgi:hypothetical protein